MPTYILVNNDGTVHNIVEMVSIDAIALNDDYKDLTVFEVSDINAEDCPRIGWIYNFETKIWSAPEDNTELLNTVKPARLPEGEIAEPTEGSVEPLVGGQNG